MDSGINDALLFRRDQDGETVIAKQFGTPGNHVAHAVAVDGDGQVVVVGLKDL